MAARPAARRALLRASSPDHRGPVRAVFFTGDSRTPQLGLDLRGGTHGDPHRPDARRQGRPTQRRPRAGPADHRAAGQRPRRRRGRGGHRGHANIVISVPGDNGDAGPASSAQTAAAAVPPGGPAGPEAATPPAAAASPTPTRPAPAPDAAAAPTDRPRPRRRRRGLAATPTSGRAAAPTDRRRRPPRRPTEPPATRTPPAVDPGAGGRAELRDAHLRQHDATEVDRRPEDYVAACTRGRHGQVPARPGRSSRAPTSPTRRRHPADHRRVDRLLDFNTQGPRRPGPTYTAANVGNDRSRSPSTARSISAPTINGAINGGTTQITGSFNQDARHGAGQPAQVRRAAADLQARRPRSRSPPSWAPSSSRPACSPARIGIALVFVYALLYYRAARPGDDRQPAPVRRSWSTPAWCCSAGRSASP